MEGLVSIKQGGGEEKARIDKRRDLFRFDLMADTIC